MPTAPRPPRKKPARRSAAAAARAEAEGATRTVAFLGRPLELPAELPGSLFFVWANADPTGPPNPAVIGGFLRGALGDEQYAKVQEIVAEDKVPMSVLEVLLVELVDEINAQYGLDTGESTAS